MTSRSITPERGEKHRLSGVSDRDRTPPQSSGGLPGTARAAMRIMVVLPCVCVLWACAPTAGGPSGPGSSPRRPYTDLKKDSYGPLSAAPDRICDPSGTLRPTQGADQLADGIATSITSVLASPFAGMTTIDDGIAQEGLQHNFGIPGDLGQANVAVLERTDQGVTFWYRGTVKFSEVQEAAKEYCSRKSKTAAYVGSAYQCPRPIAIRQVRMNNQPLNAQETFAIAAFDCVPAQGPASTPAPTTAAAKRK